MWICCIILILYCLRNYIRKQRLILFLLKMCSCTLILFFHLFLNIITVRCKRLLSFFRSLILNVQTIFFLSSFLKFKLNEFYLSSQFIRNSFMLFKINWILKMFLTIQTLWFIQKWSESLMSFIFNFLNMSSKIIYSHETFIASWTWKSLLNDWDTRNLLVKFIMCESRI